MTKITGLSLIILVALGAGAAQAQQAAPAVSPQPAPSLAGEAQQNIGTAQILFKLGQTQGQLAQLQDQEVAKDAYWKAYVEGIDKMVADGGLHPK